MKMPPIGDMGVWAEVKTSGSEARKKMYWEEKKNDSMIQTLLIAQNNGSVITIMILWKVTDHMHVYESEHFFLQYNLTDKRS